MLAMRQPRFGLKARGRHGACRKRPCALQKPGTSLLDDLKHSAYPCQELYDLKGWGFCAATTAMAVASLATFNVITGAITSGAVDSGGYQGDLAALGILDLRNGYSSQEVSTLLGAWGPSGCGLYLLIELIDVTCYHFGYRGTAVVLFNRLAAYLQAKLPDSASGWQWLRYLAVAPLVVAASDLLEDAAQVAVVVSWSALHPAADDPTWQAMVSVASALNVTKWALCRTGVAVGAVGAAVAAALALQQQVAGGSRGPAADE